MARYRKIEVRIWNDAKFSSMSDNGKLAFLFLLTHPNMTSLGAMRATLPGLASELGWTPKAFAEAFAEAFRKGLVEHDEHACFVGVPKFLKYNGPESPNVVKGWSQALDLIPECVLKDVLLHRVKAFTEALPEAFAKALPEAFRKAMPNQEQEQEQEQEQDSTPYKSPKGDDPAYSKAFEQFWEAYPRKVGKDKAHRSWKAALKKIRDREAVELGTAVERLLVAAREFAASSVGRGEFCPHPATWLNQGRYDDDRAEWERVESNGKPSRFDVNRALEGF